jgi:hypothetical protein
LNRQAHHPVLLIYDKGQGTGFILHRYRIALRHIVGDYFHEQRPAVIALHIKIVAPGTGFGLLSKGIGFFATGIQQPVIRQAHDGALLVKAVFEGYADIQQPLEMVPAVFTVVANFLRVRLGAGAHHHIVEHVLGVVCETAGLLYPRTAAAAHVDLSAGHCSGSTAGARQLENGDTGARIRRLDGGATAGATEADDGDIGLPVPLRHITCLARLAGVGFGHVRHNLAPCTLPLTSAARGYFSRTVD